MWLPSPPPVAAVAPVADAAQVRPEVAFDLLLVARGMDLAKLCPSWEPVQATALEDTGYAGSRDLDAVVARQVPYDARGAGWYILRR